MGVVVVVDDLDVDRSCDASRNGMSVGRGTDADGSRSPGDSVGTGPRVPAEPTGDTERGSLPVPGLLALAGSAGFAVWTSLTCFVC